MVDFNLSFVTIDEISSGNTICALPYGYNPIVEIRSIARTDHSDKIRQFRINEYGLSFDEMINNGEGIDIHVTWLTDEL